MLAIDIETVPADPDANDTDPDFLNSREFRFLGSVSVSDHAKQTAARSRCSSAKTSTSTRKSASSSASATGFSSTTSTPSSRITGRASTSDTSSVALKSWRRKPTLSSCLRQSLSPYRCRHIVTSSLSTGVVTIRGPRSKRHSTSTDSTCQTRCTGTTRKSQTRGSHNSVLTISVAEPDCPPTSRLTKLEEVLREYTRRDIEPLFDLAGEMEIGRLQRRWQEKALAGAEW